MLEAWVEASAASALADFAEYCHRERALSMRCRRRLRAFSSTQSRPHIHRLTLICFAAEQADAAAQELERGARIAARVSMLYPTLLDEVLTAPPVPRRSITLKALTPERFHGARRDDASAAR